MRPIVTTVFRILLVCTANICRSPAAAELLSRRLAPYVDRGVIEITSAGVTALPGSPGCATSGALVAELGPPSSSRRDGEHTSRAVTAALVDGADVIFALDRSHRAALAQLSPAARARTFTLRQAAGLSADVSGYLTGGSVPPGADPMPDDTGARLHWWVTELDAARGRGAIPPTDPPPEWDPADVPDPHVVGDELHRPAVSFIAAATETVAAGIVEVVTSRVDPVPRSDT